MNPSATLNAPAGPARARASQTAAPPAPALAPAAIAADSRLLSDYVLTDDILLDPEATTPLAVFQNPQGQSEALAIHVDGLLYHVYRDAGASGWNLREVGGGTQVDEVVAERHIDGTLQVLFVDQASNVYGLSQGTDGTWSQPQSLGTQATNVSITAMFDSAAPLKLLVGCAVSPPIPNQGPGRPIEIFVYETGGSVAPIEIADQLLQTTIQLIPSASNPWLLCRVKDGRLALRQLNVEDGTFQAGGWTEPTLVNGDGVPDLSILIPVQGRTATLLALDDKQMLWTITPIDINTVQCTQVCTRAVTHACLATRADDPSQLQIYALDAGGQLWVIRQNGRTPESYPQWFPAVPLGDNFARFATRPGATSAADLFALDTGGALRHMFQDAATTRWTSAPVRQPATSTPQSVSRYHSVVTVTGANGLPAANTAVTITPDSPTTLWIGGAAHYAAPDHPVTCQTSAHGQLTVVSPAFHLHPATLQVAAGSAALSVNPAEHVHAFLRGAAGLNGMAPLDATGSALISTTVTNANGTTSPLAPTIANQPDTKDQARLASTAASGILHAMNYPLGKTAAPPAIAGWTLNLTDPRNPTFQTFGTAAELAAHRAARQLTVMPVDDEWSQLGTFIGDVWHAIENGILSAVEWTVNVIRNTVDLTIMFMDQTIATLTDIVMDGIAGIVSVAQSIFAAIGAFIEELVAWLHAVFNWSDIWNTAQVFEYLFATATPVFLTEVVERGLKDTEGFFAGLKDEVDQAMDGARQQLQGKTVASLATSHAVRRAPLPGAAAPTTSTDVFGILMQSTETMWLWSNVFHYLPDHTFDNVPPIDTSDGVQAVSSMFNDSLKDLQAAINESGLESDMANAYYSLQAFFDDVVNPPSGSSAGDAFNNKQVTDLLDAVKNLIHAAIDLLDLAAEAVIALLKKLLDETQVGIQKVLQATLDIPVVSWLYQEIQTVAGSKQPEALTIAGLIALLLAAPATPIYKTLDSNRRAPFDDNAVQEILAWTPRLPGTTALRAPGDDTPFLPEALRDVDKVLFGALSVVLAGLDTMTDGASLSQSSGSSGMPSDTVLGWADVGVSALLQLLSIPDDETWFQTTAERWIDGVWLGGWVVPGLNAALLVPQVKETLHSEEWGKVVLSIAGAAMIGFGVTAAVEGQGAGENGWNIAAAILSPMDNALQFLTLKTLVDSTEGATLVGKLAANVLADLGAGGMSAIG